MSRTQKFHTFADVVYHTWDSEGGGKIAVVQIPSMELSISLGYEVRHEFPFEVPVTRAIIAAWQTIAYRLSRRHHYDKTTVEQILGILEKAYRFITGGDMDQDQLRLTSEVAVKIIDTHYVATVNYKPTHTKGVVQCEITWNTQHLETRGAGWYSRTFNNYCEYADVLPLLDPAYIKQLIKQAGTDAPPEPDPS